MVALCRRNVGHGVYSVCTLQKVAGTGGGCVWLRIGEGRWDMVPIPFALCRRLWKVGEEEAHGCIWRRQVGHGVNSVCAYQKLAGTGEGGRMWLHFKERESERKEGEEGEGRKKGRKGRRMRKGGRTEKDGGGS